MWPIQLAFFHFTLCRYSSPTSPFVSLHFSHDPSNWFSPSFSRTTFQNFPDSSDVNSEESKFQHQTTVSSTCKIYIFFPLNLCPFYGAKSFLLFVQFCVSNDNPVFNLPPNIQSTLLLDKYKILNQAINIYFCQAIRNTNSLNIFLYIICAFSKTFK